MGLYRIIPIAAITFFAMVSRELVKDAEDVEGDLAGGADTVPIRIGIKKTAEIALIITFFAVAASFIPYFWWGGWYLAGIIVVDVNHYLCRFPRTSLRNLLVHKGFKRVIAPKSRYVCIPRRVHTICSFFVSRIILRGSSSAKQQVYPLIIPQLP